MTVLRTDWLKDPDTQHVCKVLKDGGADVYFVGGCVRNALLGAGASDLDLCTNMRPERVIDDARLRACSRHYPRRK